MLLRDDRTTHRPPLPENAAMRERHILIVDDCPYKLAVMRDAAQAAHPNGIIHEAENVREALRHIDVFGNDIDAGSIDYDLPDGTGAEVIAAIRGKNVTASVALFTARRGGAFEEAKTRAMNAGANVAYSSTESSCGELAHALAAY
jgi:DNA-binding NarL/FixJ family response regulator